MGKFQDEMDKLDDTKKKKKPSPVKKCQYVNCPMTAIFVDNTGHRCSYHDSGDYHAEVTMAIRQNEKLITNYHRMVFWKPGDWQNPKLKEWLINKPNCPMKENELPSLYLVRYNKWLHDKVKIEASRLVEKKLQNVITGTYQEAPEKNDETK